MKKLKNFIANEWNEPLSGKYLDVINPATEEVTSQVPLSNLDDLNVVINATKKIAPDWRNTPVTKRVQYLYKLKTLLEEHADELSEICTIESGKTFDESRAELQRAIENVEVACGMPTLIQSEFSEDIAHGIDEFMIRQPVGIAACITPFNFPIMIPFWFLPYAVASGNTFIVKPSEKVPETMNKLAELIKQSGIPQGVVNVIHGDREIVDEILEHKDIAAVSFVGSSKVAKHIYTKASAEGKRVQASGGAKNPIVIMPDADIEMTTKIIVDSVYGCAGQRCLAAANVITIGESTEKIKNELIKQSKDRKVGNGLDKETEMGPVISKESYDRVHSIIDTAVAEGADLLLDGRKNELTKGKGYFINPTVLDNVPIDGEIIKTEIFGPVMSLIHFNTLDDAIEFINSSSYGNAACIFTQTGAVARKFRHDVMAGNIGVNIGIAAPMAFFPFSGWNDSFYGDLHAQAKHAVEFYTQTKIVIERWFKEWNRKF